MYVQYVCEETFNHLYGPMEEFGSELFSQIKLSYLYFKINIKYKSVFII